MSSFILLLVLNPLNSCYTQNTQGQQPRNNTMETDYKIVSSTDGKIKEIICSVKGNIARTMDKYFGLCKAFGVERVTKIYRTIDIEPNTIRLLSQHSEYFQDLTALLISNMGKQNFDKFNTNPFNNTFIKNIDKAILDSTFNYEPDQATIDIIEKRIAEEVKKSTISEIKSRFNNIRQLPEVIVEVNTSQTLIKPRLDRWVQDMFISLQEVNTNKQKIIYSENEPPKCKESALRMKECNSEIEIESSLLNYLEGGNILASGNFAVIGKKILKYNCNNSTDLNCEKETEDKLKTDFKVDHIIWSGSDKRIPMPGIEIKPEFHQAIFHVDLYLSPSGLIKEINGVTHNLIFIGYIDTVNFYTKDYINSFNRKDVIAPLVQYLIDSENDFHAYYNRLKPDDKPLLPFTFVKIPILPVFLDSSNSIMNYVSYLNNHIEIYDSVKEVYLPTYTTVEGDGINSKAAYDAAKKAYNDEGFHVTPVEPALPKKSLDKGALHCYSKVMYRSQ